MEPREVQQEIETALGNHPMLGGMAHRHIRCLAQCASMRVFAAGEFLWRQGDASDCLVLIQEGEVSMEVSIPVEGPYPVETVVAGGFLGYLQPGQQNRRRFDARAVTKVVALWIDGSCAREQCEQDEGLGYQLMKRLVAATERRLDRTRLRLIQPESAASRPAHPAE